MNRCSVCGHEIPKGGECALGPGVAACYHCESRRKKDVRRNSLSDVRRTLSRISAAPIRGQSAKGERG
jgi:hypothetical protein